MDAQRAARLLGTSEQRAAPLTQFEVRAGSGNTFVVRGYASVVEHAYDVYGGPAHGGFTETIARDAFNATLAQKPDVSFLINHEGMPLARTRSGTLALRADSTGLEAEATVDRRDPFGQALEVKLERGDLDQMSFGFRVTRQSWNEDYTDRRVIEVDLDQGDVSVVNQPANPATSVGVVAARSALAALREADLTGVEIEELRALHAHLGNVIGHPALSLTEARQRMAEHRSSAPGLSLAEARRRLGRQRP